MEIDLPYLVGDRLVLVAVGNAVEDGAAPAADRLVVPVGYRHVLARIAVGGRAKDDSLFAEAQAPGVVVRRAEELEVGDGRIFAFAFDLEAETSLAEAGYLLAVGEDRPRIVVPLHGPVPVVETVLEIAHAAVRIAHVPTGDQRLAQVGFIVAVGVLEVDCLAAILDNRPAAIEGDGRWNRKLISKY